MLEMVTDTEQWTPPLWHAMAEVVIAMGHAEQVKDNKGDTLEYPKVIRSLPFWDTANTYFFNDDYTVNCNGQYSDQSGGKVRLCPEGSGQCPMGSALVVRVVGQPDLPSFLGFLTTFQQKLRRVFTSLSTTFLKIVRLVFLHLGHADSGAAQSSGFQCAFSLRGLAVNLPAGSHSASQCCLIHCC